MHKWAIVLTLSLAACTSTYQTESFDAPSQPLSRSGSAYVMLAHDGAYGHHTYAGSGRTVSQHLYGAVSQYVSRVELAQHVEGLDHALASARIKGITYVFEPVILGWEDRATEWSGRLDRITVRIGVWEVATGKQIASAMERASSKWLTLGGDHPQDLVPHMMANFANRMFR